MGFLIACAIVLSFSNAEDVMKEIPVEERIQSIFPVLIAIFSTTFLSGRSILCKYYVEKGYNVYNFAMQLLFKNKAKSRKYGVGGTVSHFAGNSGSISFNFYNHFQY